MSADGDTVRQAIRFEGRSAALAALARLEAAARWNGAIQDESGLDLSEWMHRCRDAEAQRDALAEALREIANLFDDDDADLRAKFIARAALAEAGLE